MYIFPLSLFIKQRPRAYIERTCKSFEVACVKCKVVIIITFMENNCIEDKQCGFLLEVHLSENEYREHKSNLAEYVCRKAKEQTDYKAIIDNCIEKNAEGRDYNIEVFLPQYDPFAIDVQFVHHEWKEYVPTI